MKLIKWLGDLATLLVSTLKIALLSPSSLAALGLWLNIFQRVAESNGDPNGLYPILQQNLDILDDNFAQLVSCWAEENLAGVEPEVAQSIAINIGNFSNLIWQFPLGSRASNVEIALAGYEAIASIFNRDTYPELWAFHQMNQGGAYLYRVRGNRSENLELAIEKCQSALQFFTQQTYPEQWASVQTNLCEIYRNRIEGSHAQNIDLAIEYAQLALAVFSEQNFPEQWAATQLNLGNAYISRMHKDRSQDIEQAIEAYQVSLHVYTKEKSPALWAMAHNNLAAAYCQRIREDKSQNLRLAIQAYQQSLQIYNEQDFPEQWAMTQLNLGNCYCEHVLGNRTQNLEMAIAAYENALTVVTQEALPEQWAMIQICLGEAYRNRLCEERVLNLETAIAHFQQALQIYTQQDFPEQWAMIQNNLGNAYTDRIQGDREENLERAIVAYELAQEIYTQITYPSDWAMTTLNLACTYFSRVRGERAENIEFAIRLFNQTLQIYTQSAFPEPWARVKNNLGIAYEYRIKGNHEENLRQAVSAFQSALEVYKRETFPEHWATIQNNLGNVYSDLVKQNSIESWNLAIEAYRTALQVRTQEAFPEQWAKTHNNLGNVFSARGQISEAIEYYRLALSVLKPETSPTECLQAGRNFGKNAINAQHWSEAIEGYGIAVEALERSRTWANTGARRKEIMSEAIDIYANIVLAYINTEQFIKAIEYVERSKTRNLVELLYNRDLLPKGDIPDAIIARLKQLRQAVIAEQNRIELVEVYSSSQLIQDANDSQDNARNWLLDRSKINYLQKQLDSLIQEEIQPYDPNFSLTQRVQAIEFSAIQQSIPNENTSLIEWYITGEKLLGFVVNKYTPVPIVWQSSSQTLQAFLNWVGQYLDSYYNNRQQWKSELNVRLHQLAEILEIDNILSLLPKECNQLIFIPHIFLHVPALHALPLADGSCLLDRFPRGVNYAPSCQLLQISQRQKHPHFHNLIAIQNPTIDLTYSDLEIEAIQSMFPEAKVLKNQDATKLAFMNQDLSTIHCAHFSCHGIFNLQSPLESALFLAEGSSAEMQDTRLLLEEIFNLNLSQCRLATLSACETGLTDFTVLSDEYIGLPSGFLYAGSPSVVSSLWGVNDLSTALLMAKFYENLRTESSIAIALNQAQCWLRDSSKANLETWIKDQPFYQSPTIRLMLRQRLHKIPDNTCPFAEPFYWAAFCAIGQP